MSTDANLSTESGNLYANNPDKDDITSGVLSLMEKEREQGLMPEFTYDFQINLTGLRVRKFGEASVPLGEINEQNRRSMINARIARAKGWTEEEFKKIVAKHGIMEACELVMKGITKEELLGKEQKARETEK